jgi:hypothetical protein
VCAAPAARDCTSKILPYWCVNNFAVTPDTVPARHATSSYKKLALLPSADRLNDRVLIALTQGFNGTTVALCDSQEPVEFPITTRISGLSKF